MAFATALQTTGHRSITIPVLESGLVRKCPRASGTIGGIQAQYECIRVLSETEFYDDLATTDVPVLVMRGEDDQISRSPRPARNQSSS